MANDKLPMILPQLYTISLYPAFNAFIVHVKEQLSGTVFMHDRFKVKGDARAAYLQVLCNLTNSKKWRITSGHDNDSLAYAVVEFVGEFKDIYDHANSNHTT